MIRLTFDDSDRRVASAFRERGTKIMSAVGKAMQEAMIELERRVQEKLSGGVLQTRRGAGGLLGSVREGTANDGNRVVGYVQAGGGIFWWAIVHEHGGTRAYVIVPVNKQALAFFPTGSAGASFGATARTRLFFKLGAKRGQLRPNRSSEFGAAGGVVVKKVNHPPLPQRAFMRPSLDEMRARIVEKLFNAAGKALQ